MKKTDVIEIKKDISDMKKDIKSLLRFKWQIMGGTAVTAFIASLIIPIVSLFK